MIRLFKTNLDTDDITHTNKKYTDNKNIVSLL